MTVSIELQFDAPKGQRMHRYGMGVTVMDDGDPLWWDYEGRQWISGDDASARGIDVSSHVKPVRTLRAFRRHLRRHAEALRGRRVVWVSRYMGNDVTATIDE